MNSQEFGLLAARILLQPKYLHYGFWELEEKPSLESLPKAQERYEQFILQAIQQALANSKSGRLLDVGCGIGVTTLDLLKLGYPVDGLVPSEPMFKEASGLIQDYPDSQIYHSRLEDLPAQTLNGHYQLAFFSESFQYIQMEAGFEKLKTILSDEGQILILDFFRKDNVAGTSPLGGGQSIGKFFTMVESKGFEILQDQDLTAHLSPNMRLIEELVKERLFLLFKHGDQFLLQKYSWFYRFLKKIFAKRIDKLHYKYIHRNQANFEKYKTYRLFVLKRKVTNLQSP